MPVIPAPCAPGGGSNPTPVQACCSPSITSTPLCLADGTPILLVLQSGCADCGTDAGAPEVAGWTNLASGTFTPGPAPAGAGPCSTTAEPCEPVPMCPGLLGLVGPETWIAPVDAESLSVSVACGPVTVTDCGGNATVVNECGTSLSWSATGTACAPGVLCGPVTVDVPEGAAVYVQWLAPCGGDES